MGRGSGCGVPDAESPHDRCLRRELSRMLAVAQCQRDLARVQGAAVETGVDGRAQHPLGIAERAGVAEALRLQIRQGLAVNRAGSLCDAGLRSALQSKPVVSVPRNRNAVAGRRELEAIAQIIQQTLLEAAQSRLFDFTV